MILIVSELTYEEGPVAKNLNNENSKLCVEPRAQFLRRHEQEVDQYV